MTLTLLPGRSRRRCPWHHREVSYLTARFQSLVLVAWFSLSPSRDSGFPSSLWKLNSVTTPDPTAFRGPTDGDSVSLFGTCTRPKARVSCGIIKLSPWSDRRRGFYTSSRGNRSDPPIGMGSTYSCECSIKRDLVFSEMPRCFGPQSADPKGGGEVVRFCRVLHL